MRIVWSPQSLRDLDAIHAYIARDSRRYADLTLARILAAIERLVEFSDSGRMIPNALIPKFEKSSSAVSG